MYIWTYIILLALKREHAFPTNYIQIFIQRSSNIFEATKRTIWKDENVDLFIKYLYMYINYKY